MKHRGIGKEVALLAAVMSWPTVFMLLAMFANVGHAAEPLTWQSPCPANAVPLFKVVKPDSLEMRCKATDKPFMTMQGCVGPKAKKVTVDGKTNVQITCASWNQYKTGIPMDWVCTPPPEKVQGPLQ